MDRPATPRLLRIDASTRLADSFSRRVADGVQRAWQQAHPHGSVLQRDLVAQPLPHVSDLTIQGYYTPPEAMTPALRAATALSDSLIAELQGAHTVLIASPIYNFSIPSSLKAWIDHIVRIGHTFAYDGGQFRGLARPARAVLALAYGAGGYEGPLAAMDHLRPYLVSLLGFIGITDVRTVAVEATTGEPAAAQAALERALAEAAALFAPAELAR